MKIKSWSVQGRVLLKKNSAGCSKRFKHLSPRTLMEQHKNTWPMKSTVLLTSIHVPIRYS